LTPEEKFVCLDSNLNPVNTGYKKVGACEHFGDIYYIIKRDDAKLGSERYGMIGPRGTIVCPLHFYTPDLKVEKLDRFDGPSYLISSDSINSKQVLTKDAGKSVSFPGGKVKVNSILLAGDEIVPLMSWRAYCNHKELASVPFGAVYNKQTNSSDIYSCDIQSFKCNKIASVNGCVFKVVEQEHYHKFYYFVADENNHVRFVSADGKVNVCADAVGKLEDIRYAGSYRKDGSKIMPPFELSIHVTTEEPFAMYKDGKIGLFDTTLDKVMLEPKFNKILIATKTDDGQGRFLVENDKKHFGVVDANGKSIVPFYMTNIVGLKEIDFDKDKRFVAQMSVETKSGVKYIYVDPASPTGIASSIEVDRFLVASGKKRGAQEHQVGEPKIKEEEN